MGCWTWTYEKLKPQPKEEDLIKEFIKSTIGIRDNLKKVIAGTMWIGPEYKNLDSYHPYKSQQEAENDLPFFEWCAENAYRVLDFREKYNEVFTNVPYNEWPNEALLFDDFINKMGSGLNRRYDAKTGYFFKETVEGSSLFRGRDYKAPHLYSLAETLQYIKDNPQHVEDVHIRRIKKFWKEHPDGMIDFG